MDCLVHGISHITDPHYLVIDWILIMKKMSSKPI